MSDLTYKCQACERRLDVEKVNDWGERFVNTMIFCQPCDKEVNFDDEYKAHNYRSHEVLTCPLRGCGLQFKNNPEDYYESMREHLKECTGAFYTCSNYECCEKDFREEESHDCI